MKLAISREAALAAAFVAVTARLFYGLTVEEGAIHNGAWLAALFSALPAIPLVQCLDAINHRRTPAAVALSLFLLAAVLSDGGAVLAALVRSTGFLALERGSGAGLTLPVCGLMFWCVCRNGDAAGYGAMLFMRLFPALGLIVLLLQARHFRPEWLRPILGSGRRDILRQGVRCAGLFVPTTALLFVSDRLPGAHLRKRASLLSLGAVAAGLLTLPVLMMAPTSKGGGDWLYRLDALLTNGRAPLYLQLPLVVLWYAGLLHLLLCECFSGAALLQRLMPRLDGRACGALTAVGVGALSVLSCPAMITDGLLGPWGYVAAASLTAVVTLTGMKGGGGACGERGC